MWMHTDLQNCFAGRLIRLSGYPAASHAKEVVLFRYGSWLSGLKKGTVGGLTQLYAYIKAQAPAKPFTPSVRNYHAFCVWSKSNFSNFDQTYW
jgi:hypothetical protein